MILTLFLLFLSGTSPAILLNPSPDYVIAAGDQIIVIAEDDDSYEPKVLNTFFVIISANSSLSDVCLVIFCSTATYSSSQRGSDSSISWARM